MKLRSLSITTALLSCAAMLIAPVNAAGIPVTTPRDVMLQEGGVLVGQVVDVQGAPISQANVSLLSGGKEVACGQSDQAGKFSVSGLSGGVYQVVSAEHQGVYRLWAPQTAPPAAQRGLMVVSSKDLIRAQGCACGVPGCTGGCGAGAGGGPFGGVGNWVANHPLITAGAVAAAIAIPLALDDDDPPPATP